MARRLTTAWPPGDRGPVPAHLRMARRARTHSADRRGRGGAAGGADADMAGAVPGMPQRCALMGRQHKAAVAALDLDPLPMTWAQRLAWHLPDDQPEPVLCAAWQTIARWLKRPEPTGNAAKLYVKRVIRKLIELGVLVRT